MKRYVLAGGLGLVLVILDQLSKLLVMQSIPLHQSIPVIDGFFNLVHVHNRGAAFGFLNRSDIEWQFWLFAAFTLLAVVLVIYMLRGVRDTDFFALTAFGAILGGAAGNFIDRLRFRYVVDFLDFHIGSLHWPAFNVADIAITYGVLAFALITFFPRRGGFSKKA